MRSTNYCLTGNMADGHRVRVGAVAKNDVPFGTKYRILTGPYTGRIVTVEDRYGHGTQFDIYVDSCRQAFTYGRRTVQIERLP